MWAEAKVGKHEGGESGEGTHSSESRACKHKRSVRSIRRCGRGLGGGITYHMKVGAQFVSHSVGTPAQVVPWQQRSLTIRVVAASCAASHVVCCADAPWSAAADRMRYEARLNICFLFSWRTATACGEASTAGAAGGLPALRRKGMDDERRCARRGGFRGGRGWRGCCQRSRVRDDAAATGYSQPPLRYTYRIRFFSKD